MTENLDAFLDEFAVDCVKPGGTTVKVIYDSPDSEVLGSMVVEPSEMITGKTSDLNDLAENDSLTVDGRAYTVRKLLKIDDGIFTQVYLAGA
jgi:hypothetical protein